MSTPAPAPDPTPDSGARISRLERLLRVSLGLSGVSMLINLALAYVVFAVVLAEPAVVAGVTGTGSNSPVTDEDGDYREEMRTFFLRMEDVLDREARRQGVNPSEVVPTRDQINDAVETRTMHSDESQLALQKLREGFDLFELTWPSAIPER
jgi:hypothetical protein